MSDQAGLLRRHMVNDLIVRRLLPDDRWKRAFLEVPRHVFLPRFFIPGTDADWRAVDSTDPDWLELVYSDRVLVTQLDDDPDSWPAARTLGFGTGVATSSSSMPAIMSIMLHALLAEPGHRVLEIGAGTGYNAGLLCHFLGTAAVTSVDIDPTIVEQAHGALAHCGFHPTVTAADGAAGYPANAPYDRLLATCAVSRIPDSWLDQVTPGGQIVTTLHRPIGAGLVRLTVGSGYAEGRVLAEDGRFMPLRAHRAPALRELLIEAEQTPKTTRHTTLTGTAVTSAYSDFEFFAGLMLPEAQAVTVTPDGGTTEHWLVDTDGSWARHTTRAGDHWVDQGGPRQLWNLAELAHDRWHELGRPGRDRFGLTVRKDTQYFWLDSPDSAHTWPFPPIREQ
ncbi:protein-L-isoaspartate O-methyltransferase [Pseudonocardiaceae bacterium YIM PH 21723]|nr:protein-L-isoaspartate O-methyltransferase [Pseudonocardiaceae bacterium YIM PH 21723]